MVLICISLMISNTENLFICFLVIWISSFKECLWVFLKRYIFLLLKFDLPTYGITPSAHPSSPLLITHHPVIPTSYSPPLPLPLVRFPGLGVFHGLSTSLIFLIQFPSFPYNPFHYFLYSPYEWNHMMIVLQFSHCLCDKCCFTHQSPLVAGALWALAPGKWVIQRRHRTDKCIPATRGSRAGLCSQPAWWSWARSSSLLYTFGSPSLKWAQQLCSPHHVVVKSKGGNAWEEFQRAPDT